MRDPVRQDRVTSAELGPGFWLGSEVRHMPRSGGQGSP